MFSVAGDEEVGARADWSGEARRDETRLNERRDVGKQRTDYSGERGRIEDVERVVVIRRIVQREREVRARVVREGRGGGCRKSTACDGGKVRWREMDAPGEDCRREGRGDGEREDGGEEWSSRDECAAVSTRPNDEAGATGGRGKAQRLRVAVCPASLRALEAVEASLQLANGRRRA